MNTLIHANSLIHTGDDGARVVRLDPKKRVLFLTEDLDLIRRQLRGEVDLRMQDVDPVSDRARTHETQVLRRSVEQFDLALGLIERDPVRFQRVSIFAVKTPIRHHEPPP